MPGPLRLLCITAHPDDETLAAGGTLARYAREGVKTYVVTATRGEAGRHGTAAERPSSDAIGRARECEEREAAAILDVRGVWFLDCRDGKLDQEQPSRVIGELAAHIRRIRPQVVITLPPYGGDGHPDHIAVSQLATAAVFRAADSTSVGEAGSAHSVSKLYYVVWTRATWDIYQAAFGPLRFVVDGMARTPAPWPDWAVTTVLDTSAVWETVWDAMMCHRSQVAGVQGIVRLKDEAFRSLWEVQRFYRAFTMVNGGRACESDLFEGLR
jgi:LmbE family N-acetylglucosaminyl deacetylase